LVSACLFPSRGLDCETWWLLFETLRPDSILTAVASFLVLILLKFNFPTPFSFNHSSLPSSSPKSSPSTPNTPCCILWLCLPFNPGVPILKFSSISYASILLPLFPPPFPPLPPPKPPLPPLKDFVLEFLLTSPAPSPPKPPPLDTRPDTLDLLHGLWLAVDPQLNGFGFTVFSGFFDRVWGAWLAWSFGVFKVDVGGFWLDE
jgi:hypothetical protein